MPSKSPPREFAADGFRFNSDELEVAVRFLEAVHHLDDECPYGQQLFRA